MRIMVYGFRGFPGVEGGIETHAENLYPLLANMGCEIRILVRKPYFKKNRPNKWKSIQFRSLWAPTAMASPLEAVVHSFLCVFYAGLKRPQLLHVHGGAATLTVPLARLLGLKVLVTNHGPDYESEKWGPIARWVLRIAESLGMRFSSKRIAVSKEIRRIVRKKYNRSSSVIPNGVEIPKILLTTNTLQQFGLKPHLYILLVSRFVEHKRHIDLIRAFTISNLINWKLVLVGDLDLKYGYTQKVFSYAKKCNNIVFTGFQTGTALGELFSNAGLFVLPSSYEGLPIALLEALSYGVRVLASDIPAHLEIGLPEDQYYPLGDSDALSKKIIKLSSLPFEDKSKENLRRWVKNNYNWPSIAHQTFEVYNSV